MQEVKTDLKIVEFNSPTHGRLFFAQVIEKIGSYIKESKDHKYKVIIGTDSAGRNGKEVEFITAVVVHKVGAGGIYFWQKVVDGPFYTLRDRIYEETLLSIALAQQILIGFKSANLIGQDIEIHLDVGEAGETRDIISEVVGMVRGNGFDVKTKPAAYGASKVADKHT